MTEVWGHVYHTPGLITRGALSHLAHKSLERGAKLDMVTTLPVCLLRLLLQ